MRSFRKTLESGHFAITAELTPPREPDLESLAVAAKILKPAVTAINLTDGAGARVRVCSLAAAIHLRGLDVEPILQMTCRDRNRIAIKSDLLAAAAFGIESVLTLTGDGVDAGDMPEAMPVFDLDSTTLLTMIRDMSRDSLALDRNDRNHAPAFFRGAADAPVAIDDDWRPAGLLAKIEAGAQFVQSQYCFDMQLLERYMQRLSDSGVTERVYFLVGLGPLKSAAGARWMRDTLYGTIIPDGIIRRMEAARDPRHEGIVICSELIQQAREIRGVSGVHLMAPGQHREIVEAIRFAGLT
ncbi:MAG: methylenetetrahydrofolate reductase [Gammaproteobacteria bacterium]|nr:methylenetetrahydrofolate reductase [Gammaproteobacteria bacterium]MDH4313866.1 methylenetetrahydrofolate reductase [Gammaproteobacteria bacterium]MDH5215195.1 methylenetetrahydrofolate reductase [Gammaproteobacteria bacterium]MDH5499537.1 methylenetetrahydrofolate reductase [Gammaproteobacteria bacterium]